MDFGKILAAIRRFWPVVLAVLILTGIGVASVPSNIAPEYEASGTVILLSPSTEGDKVTGKVVAVNPWSRFGASGEGVAGTALIELLESAPFEERIMANDAVEEYDVAPNPGGNGAILDISVLASNGEAALDTYDLIVDRLVSELDSRQEAAGAPVEKRLRAELLTDPSEATELLGSQIRAMAAIGLLGAFAAVALAVALDTIRPRREPAESPSDEAETLDDPDAEPPNPWRNERSDDAIPFPRAAPDAGGRK